MDGSNRFCKKYAKCLIDLSATFSTLALKMIIIETVTDKYLFSSDAPYDDSFLNKQAIEYLSPSKKISDKVLGENIIKLLGLK